MNNQFPCKYCDKEVEHYGGICPTCDTIVHKVREEEKRYWATVVKQELLQITNRMK